MLHLQEIVRRPLNVLADLVAVSRTIKKRPQDEHVKRALQKRRCAAVSVLPWKTFDPQLMMVDTRLSIVNGRRRGWILNDNTLIDTRNRA